MANSGDTVSLCKRCGTQPTTHDIRSELVCRECFCKYVEKKVVKRLEAFRVRNSTPGKPRKLLLTLSFGICSTSMLHILQQVIERQKARTGRAGYDLRMLYIDDQTASDISQSRLEKLRALYSKYEFSTVNLLQAECIALDQPDFETAVDGSDGHSTTGPNIHSDELLEAFSKASSPTSHSDVMSIALMRSAVAQAKKLDCESILWGDSTTRLAEKILAETAKGRGYGLPFLITDGPSPFGVDFNYPMRDLLRKELVAYAEARNLQVFDSPTPKSSRSTPISAKTMSIDGLMGEYFESVEDAYPSIVANVVRTSSKLEADVDDPENRPCSLCGMPVDKNSFGLENWEGSQGTDNAIRQSQLCYACTRSVDLRSALPRAG